MNIAYITNLFPPVQTGTAQYTADLSQAMTKLGHNVTVICPSVSGRRFTESARGAVRVIGVPAIRLKKFGPLMGFDDFYLTENWMLTNRLTGFLKENKVDVIHQCGHLLDLTHLTPALAKKLDIPCVCSVHTKIYHPSANTNRAFQAVDDLLVGPTMRKYNRVVALDAEMAKYVINRYRVAAVNLPYGVNPVTGFCKRDDGHKYFQITSVGHVTRMRSREDLLQACDELIDEGLDIRVSVVGKLCYESKKQYKHSDRFRFTGELFQSGVLREWETSDLEAHWLTMPGIGTAILEAMSCGVPCLTNGYSRILNGASPVDWENILFTVPGFVSGVKDIIRLLYESREIGNSIGQRGHDLVNNYLTWDKVAPEYDSLYQEVCHAG